MGYYNRPRSQREFEEKLLNEVHRLRVNLETMIKLLINNGGK